jgi:uncharacterized damage-inducible protein DinB
MKSKIVFLTILVLSLAILSTLTVCTQEKNSTGFKADILEDLAGVEKKYIDLANAMKEDQFTWRPGEGIRSVSEANMHVAGTTYFFLNMLGHELPKGINITKEYKSTFELEKITEKEKVISTVKESFKYLKDMIEKTPDSKLSESMDFFGTPSSLQSVLLMMTTHIHEHLGQLIAYARVNNVVPPWSK